MDNLATLRRRVFGGPGRLWIPATATAMMLANLALVVWAIQLQRRSGGGFGLQFSVLFTLAVLGLVGLGVVLHSWGRRWKDAARAERLQEDEASLRLLASQLPADVWTTDTELRLTSASGALLARLEAPEARVPGRTLYEVFGTQDVGHPVIAAHLQALRGESVTYHRTVGPIILEGRVEPLRDGRGAVIGCVGVAVDVTDRKRAETALRESEERFRVALRDLAIFVGTMDRELRYTWAYNMRHGFRPEDVLGKRPDELIGVDEAKGMMDLLREVLSSGAGRRREVSGRTRGERWSYDQIVEPLRGERGEVIGLTVAAVDVTERRAAEQQQRLLADALKGASDMISVTDEENRFIYVNEAFLHTYGFTREELLGQTPALLGAPDSIQHEIFGQTLRDGWTGEIVNRRKGGAEIPVSLHTTLIRDSEGRVIGLLGVARDISERRRSDEVLGRYRALVESSHDAIIGVSLDGNIESWNAGAEDLYGYRAEEVIGRPLEILVPPDQVNDLGIILEGLRHGHRMKHYETERVRKDGVAVAVSVTASPIRVGGRVVGISGIHRDITERKRVAEQVQRLAAIVESSEDAIVSSATDGTILTWNHAAEKLFGYLAQEVIGKPVSILAPPERMEEMRHNIQRLSRGESVGPYDTERVRSDGRVISVAIAFSPIRDGSGSVEGAAGIVRDITERKRAEEALRQSEAMFRLMTENATDIITRHAPDGTFLYVSPACRKLLGYDARELVGRSPFEFIHPDDATATTPTREARQLPTNYSVTFRFRRKDGTYAWVESLGHMECDQTTGAVTEYHAVSRDVTDRMRVEGQLRRQGEELRALARHLESVREDEHTRMAREIHDGLGQALTALRLDLSWLAKKLPEASAAVRQKIGAMVSLTDDTIEAGRNLVAELRPPILDDLGLAPSLEWYVQHFAKRAGLRHEWNPGPAELFVDREVAVIAYRIVQEALTNVARHAQAKHVAVRLGEQDGALTVEIRDDGRGISEDAVGSPRSLGIVGMRERALARGGSLAIGRLPEGGTSVRVTIPIERRREPRATR